MPVPPSPFLSLATTCPQVCVSTITARERAPAATPFAIALCFIDGFMAAKLQAFTCNGRVCAALKVMPLSASFRPGPDDPPPPCVLAQLSVPAVCRIT